MQSKLEKHALRDQIQQEHQYKACEDDGGGSSHHELQSEIIELATSSDNVDTSECVESPLQYSRNRDTENLGDTPSRHELQKEFYTFGKTYRVACTRYATVIASTEDADANYE